MLRLLGPRRAPHHDDMAGHALLLLIGAKFTGPPRMKGSLCPLRLYTSS